MIRPVFLAALLAALCLLPVAGDAKTVALNSVEVTLPPGNALYTGDGSAAINNNCLACHSKGMVLNQPNLPKAGWEAEIAKMRNVYKASITESDVPEIVDYLVRIKGAK